MKKLHRIQSLYEEHTQRGEKGSRPLEILDFLQLIFYCYVEGLNRSNRRR